MAKTDDRAREHARAAGDSKQRRVVSSVRPRNLDELLHGQKGQGTTEYAILVGVLVVIAIIAIVAFRGRISDLWQAITDGINSL